MSLNKTPNANRVHIGIYGKTNSGKSTLINLITDQETALVSDIKGTTTDPVYKAMEVKGIGPAVFIDTAGLGDDTPLGAKREKKTFDTLQKADMAIVLFSDENINYELKLIAELKKREIPYIPIINKADKLGGISALQEKVEKAVGKKPIVIHAENKMYRNMVINELTANLPDNISEKSILDNLVKQGDLVVLVMPQDIQAPKGRLILPQVQTIRELLDEKCIIVSVTADKYKEALAACVDAPKLIITDSQVFDIVYKDKPEDSLLTSFSVLFAKYKGDIEEYVKGTAAIEALNENSKVLIAESCTHAPLDGDIGRIKIPKMLKKIAGEGITIDVVSGQDFPEDLSGYDLIIQCGGCMFNRKHIMSRIEKAKQSGVKITNYGIFIAYFNNILDKITY